MKLNKIDKKIDILQKCKSSKKLILFFNPFFDNFKNK